MSLLRSNTWDCMSLLGDPFNLVFPYFLFYRNLGAYVFYVKLENLRGIESSEGKKKFYHEFFFWGGGLLDRVHFRKQKQVVFENRLSGHISRG